MRIAALLAALLAAAPIQAQTRLAAPMTVPPIVTATLSFGVAPGLLPSPSLPPSLSPVPPLALLPILHPAVAPISQAPLPVRVAALSDGISKITASLGGKQVSGDTALSAGRDIEALLTGTGPCAPSAAGEAASAAELVYAAGASPALAARADELGAAKGLKSSRMTGADFLALIEEARNSASAAPTPAAAAAAREVEAQVVRVARALIAADKPLGDSVRRALAVWQVLSQEMEAAAAHGTLAAIVADAQLFAAQVEASASPSAAAPALAEPKIEIHPEDPNGYAAISETGSVFGWKPIEDSPNHGLPPLDALIRRILAEKKGTYPKGFELAGAPRREDARVHFYGERHTDGALIAANMKRLSSETRHGKPVIILVESYVGRRLRGWPAIKYLTDRGLEPGALADRGGAGDGIEIRGWDIFANYEASQHPLLQHHMNLLSLNHMAHGSKRGWSYYREFSLAALAALKGYRELWRTVIIARNVDLDRAVAEAVSDADLTGATVHVIAGTDHLIQHPRLSGWPIIGRPSLRKALRAALGGRPHWASQPPGTLD